MSKSKFVECQNCSKIHYVVDKEIVDSLQKSVNSFSSRDMTRCANCGSKNKFSIMSEFYVVNFSSGDDIPPIFLDYEKLKENTKR